jgi:hypothetical protein
MKNSIIKRIQLLEQKTEPPAPNWIARWLEIRHRGNFMDPDTLEELDWATYKERWPERAARWEQVAEMEKDFKGVDQDAGEDKENG